MADVTGRGRWGGRLAGLALLLSAGGVLAALAAAIGSGAGAWTFGSGLSVLRYAFFAAAGGAVLAIVALVIGRRGGTAVRRWGGLALLIALPFLAYLGSQVATARSVPAIHDASTDLDDLPRFTALPVRADNLEKVPDMDRADLAALDPESRWKAIHREAYSDLKTLRLARPPADVRRIAAAVMVERGWEPVKVDPPGDTIEATDTTLFFRFKDDVAVQVRPDPTQAGASLVDVRSISRVGGSDVGVNAQRIRDFLADLRAAAT